MNEPEGSPIPPERTGGDIAACEATAKARTAIVEPLPAEHPFDAEFGRVAAAWSHLERNLDMALWQLADLHIQNGACPASGLVGVDLRCRAIIAMGTIRGLPDTLLKSARRLMHESNSVADRRARIVHASDNGTGVASRLKATPFSDPRSGHVKMREEIQAVLRRIADLEVKAWILRNQIADELLGLRKTSE